MALLEIYDAAHRALNRGRFVCLMSFDVSAAFDTVSHTHIMTTLKQFQVNGHIRRVLHGWLRGRTFQVRTRTTAGTICSAINTVSRGLPQGGVISPLLWILYFNAVPKLLRDESQRRGLPQQDFKDVIYADDVTTIIFADTLGELAERAVQTMKIMKHGMKRIGLQINEAKTQNIVLDPAVLPKGAFRRGPGTTHLGTRERRRRQYCQAAKFDKTIVDFDPWTSSGETTEMQIRKRFPVPLTETIKILGVVFDTYLTLDDHHLGLVTRAQIRQAILKKIGSLKWGVEVGILRITSESVIGSLLRYGTVVIGSCMPPDLLRKIDTQVINIAARRICGADRTIRIETLHFLTGGHNAKNRYVARCALMLDSILRATNSGIKSRITAELCGLREVEILDTRMTPIAIPEQFAEATETPKFMWTRTRWFQNQYEEPPKREPGKAVSNMFSTSAPELQETVLSQLMHYQFTQVTSWLEVATQILDYLGWAPECATHN